MYGGFQVHICVLIPRYWRDARKGSGSEEVLSLLDDPSDHSFTECQLVLSMGSFRQCLLAWSP